MVRAAVIGLGYWGPNLVRNFASVLGPDLRIVCDQCPDRVRSIERNYPSTRGVTDVNEVFTDPEIDAVAIATPVSTHFPLAKAALLAGKSVFVEKPLTRTSAEAEELIDLARAKGLVLMVDHVFLHNNAVKKMKDLADTGELGVLQYIDSVRINLGLIQNDINVVWDLAPHDISIVDYIVGRLPLSVSAFGASHTEQGLEDVAYLNLDYGDGLIANFHVNWLSPVKIRYTTVGGSKKSLVFNDLHRAEILKVYDSGVHVERQDIEDRRRILVDYRVGDVYSPHIPHCEPLRNAVNDFVGAIKKGTRPLTDGENGLCVVRILEAAEKSILRNGERVFLDSNRAQLASADARTPGAPVIPLSCPTSPVPASPY